MWIGAITVALSGASMVDKQQWGFPFRRGLFEVTAFDFAQIVRAMKVEI